MGYLELLPGDDSCCADFVGFNSEAAVFVIEHVGLLSQNPWEQTNNGPAQEAAISGCVAAIEEWILFLGVSVKVTEYPNLPFVFFLDLLHHILDP